MLKPFDIIFYKGETPIARIIKKLTNSQFSHVAIAVDSLHLVQLDWKTPVSLAHINYGVGQYEIYRLSIELTDAEKEKIVLFMRERLSTTYDWKLIFSRFFNILFGTKIISSDHLYNCDELIVQSFRSIGINLIEDDVKMTPDTLSKSKLLYKITD